MLLILSKDLDIYTLTKLFVKYKVKAKLDGNNIYVTSDIPAELIEKLAGLVTFKGIKNYDSSDLFKAPTTSERTVTLTESIPITKVDNDDFIDAKVEQVNPDSISIPCSMDEHINDEEPDIPSESEAVHYEITKVKRGEVFMCDFGVTVGSEQGGIRPAIIIQNDTGNKYSPTTIVIPVTTAQKRHLPTHHTFVFNDDNMVDYCKFAGFSAKPSVVLAEQIVAIDKSKLIRYMGTMTDEFMDGLTKIINASLNLPSKVMTKSVPKIPAPPKVTIPQSTHKAKAKPDPRITTTFIHRDKHNIPVIEPKVAPVVVKRSYSELTDAQKEILTFVDVSSLREICSSSESNQEKVTSILNLFAFDYSKRGVDYLDKAIFASLVATHYTLETLSDSIFKKDNSLPSSEILRLIVARVKERFRFKKAPTSDFIKLVNNLIKTKGALLDE